MSVGDYTLCYVIVGLCEAHTIKQRLTGWPLEVMAASVRDCDDCFIMEDE